MKSCYLAGPFTNPDWRDRIMGEVNDIAFYDPRQHSKQGAIYEFVGDDLEGVLGCDICFVYAPTGYGEVGADIEATTAFNNGKIVILCSDAEFAHPMLVGISLRVLFGLDAGIKYLKNLASHETEMEAAYAMWR